MDTRTLLITRPGGQLQRVRISKPEITLGRSALADIVISDSKASRSHARLRFGADVLVEDLASTNGTTVGGTRITTHRLQPGEIVRIGQHQIQLETVSTEVDFDRTVVNSREEIQATLIANPLEAEVNDTSIPRVAIITPKRTWEIPLEAEATVFGRGSECQALIESTRVSRVHAQIERVGDGFRLRDRGSSNGTWVSGQRVEQVMLHDGDTFTIGDARCVFKAGFGNDDLTVVEGGPKRTKRRPVVIVPGIMGSTLYDGKDQVWPNVRLLLTRPDLFIYPGKVPLTPGGLVSEVVVVPNLVKLDQYNRLTEFLCEGMAYQTGKDLLEFAYDWRQDVRITARQLGEAIERWGVTEPITIVAHSLGTLVSRYYIDRLGGAKKVERIVFLGGAHYGVPKSVVVLMQGPGFLPFGLMADQMRQVLTSFPSAHQILPVYGSTKDQQGKPIDVLEDDRWVPERQKASHAMAREFRRELPERCGVSAVSIFGYGIKTVTNVTMCRDAKGVCESLDFVQDESGDSAVPQVTSVLKGTEIHPVRQHHGALFTDKDVQMRLKLELTR